VVTEFPVVQDFPAVYVNHFFWKNPSIGSLLEGMYFSTLSDLGAEACV